MKKLTFSFLIFAIISNYCYSQHESSTSNSKYRIMFYNVENYFDAEHDSSLTYNEFTPKGNLAWTYRKYLKKRDNIYKVIKAVGEWNPVTLIGLAEIENEFVIKDLIENTPLNKSGYDFVHFESDDFRGIDVALLYHKKSFKLLHSQKIKIIDPLNPSFTTRDMLYVKGILGNDTINVVVCHWTSRYRGHLESEPYRILAAHKLLVLTDSICKKNNNANILLMGDFNDNPNNKSLQLITNKSNCNFKNIKLLSNNNSVLGTLKYKSNWSFFDQIIVSDALINGENGITCTSVGHIFDAGFLLEPDSKYLGLKTNRTNIGYKYHGGFSDHLPVYIDITTK